MTGTPDFTKIPLSTASARNTVPVSSIWDSPEGIAIKPSYDAVDINDLDFVDSYPGLAPYVRGFDLICELA